MTLKNKALQLFLLAVITFSGTATFANNRERTVKVVTYNMYLGADLTDIFQAQSEAELVSEVAEAYSDMLASDPAGRAGEVADQIAAEMPVLVGLQEVALWRTGPILDPAQAETVTVDQLQLLLDALADRGLKYSAVVVKTNLDAELPAVFGPTAALDVRFTDRIAILARGDLPVAEFKLNSSTSGHFQTLLPISSPTFGTITIPRGWASADAKLRGKNYRFITTHLESFYEPVQYGQALELIAGPANASMPVILGADLNSDAATGGSTYQLFAGSGFADTWAIANPTEAGFTWPLSAEAPTSILSPTQRIDFVMIRGNVRTLAANLVGENASDDLTPGSGRPSDHAGISATISVDPKKITVPDTVASLTTCGLVAGN